ncbi:putative structural head protein [Pseudomonas phage Psa21]|uniref:Putative structural head protein n=1 Tax=Pseudomonas phage Psa21 TaxID=2530023 RepID=A0A481W5F3_9CAUD|nr:putative structural head protein [Pseudomonas phage Psa21]QBJ02614.1 putative structural head protein [Pseudomonas phage Psa21]
MQFIIDSVLTPLITEERKEIILSCVASLESLDYQAALDELHQVVEMKDGMCDNEMLVSRIDDVIWNAHETIFKQHEVTVSAEATQEIRQSIVEVLSSFDKYIIPDQLLLLFDGDFMSEEILAHMCQLFTSVKMDEAWPEIKDVSPNLINTMREEIERQVRYRGLQDADVSPISRIKMINDYIRLFPIETFSMMLDLSRSGIRVGVRGIDELVEQSLNGLDQKEPVHAALEIFGLLLLSNVPVEQIPRKSRDLLQSYTDDNMYFTQMTEAVKPLLALLDRYKEDAHS